MFQAIMGGVKAATGVATGIMGFAAGALQGEISRLSGVIAQNRAETQAHLLNLAAVKSLEDYEYQAKAFMEEVGMTLGQQKSAYASQGVKVSSVAGGAGEVSQRIALATRAKAREYTQRLRQAAWEKAFNYRTSAFTEQMEGWSKKLQKDEESRSAQIQGVSGMIKGFMDPLDIGGTKDKPTLSFAGQKLWG
jgi:hypothetical protein